MSIISASGDVCSFKALQAGIPLKSCVSQISGYQEGSGTPSPSNVRPLHAFSSATLTENNNTHLFTFGQDIYQGYIDWKRGVIVGTWRVVDLGTINWSVYNGDKFYTTINNLKEPITISDRNKGLVCECYKPSDSLSLGEIQDQSFLKLAQTENFWIKDSNYNDPTAFKTAMNGVMLAYELATPQTIQLSGTQIETLLENNIFADCGSTSIEAFQFGR